MRYLALIVLLVACGSKKKAQSFRDGMELICKVGEVPELANVSPAEREAEMSKWLDARLTNPQARKVLEAIGEVHPRERGRWLREAADEAGVTDCPLIDASRADLDLVEVPDGVTLAEAPEGVMMVIAPTAIVIEGESIVAVHDGAVDPSELEGGARGLKIPKLEAFTEKLAQVSPGPMLVAVAPGTSYRLLLQAIYSVKRSYKDFHLLARRGSELGAVPLLLPEPPSAPVDEVERPLGMVLALTEKDALVFSASGQEGTLREPALMAKPDEVARVRAALADIAKRRWYGRSRPDADRRIVVTADAAQTMAIVLPMLAAAHESFPDLLLSTGFE